MCASSEAALRARNTQKQRDRTLHDAASHRIAAAQSPRARQLCHNGLQEAEHGDITPARRVISSVVERFVHIEDVGGSNPSSPTTSPRNNVIGHVWLCLSLGASQGAGLWVDLT